MCLINKYEKMKTSKLACRSIPLVKSRLLLFGILLALIIVLPGFIHSQWITGPIVNAVLIIAAVCVGPMEAVVLGLIPSTVALSSGLLPLPLAPMLPFIMIGNAVLIVSFQYLAFKNYPVRILVAAFLKFAFLNFSLVILTRGLLESNLIAKVAVMMSWPQFVTAVIGGVIAYPFFKSKK
jgi:hypothetical protein